MSNIDFAEVHKQADIRAKDRVKNKKYRDAMLDVLALREAHSVAYWEILHEIDNPKPVPVCATCKRPQ